MAGPFAPIGPSDREEYPWIDVLLESGMSFYLDRRRLASGTSRKRSLAFGAQTDNSNFAYPCVDMHWDGLGWAGSMSRGVWRGAGGRFMTSFWEDLDNRIGGADHESDLRCLLMPDPGPDAPKRMVWHIVSTDGRTVSLQLRPEHGPNPTAECTARTGEHSDDFACLRSLGPWEPSTFRTWVRHPWLGMAAAYNLTLNFRRQNLAETDDQGVPMSYTFGARSDEENFALLCTELLLDGRSWTGNSRREFAMGLGVSVMQNFWLDLYHRVGAVAAEMASLKCILTADDAEDPQEIIWQIVSAGGRALISVPLRRGALHAVGADA